MKKINQIFFKGLIVVLPIMLTFYLLFWASNKIEHLFGDIIRTLMGEASYIPGLGILFTAILIFLVGVLVSNYVTGRVFKWFMSKLEQFPLIKVIYNPLKDLMALFPAGEHQASDNRRVVLIESVPGIKVMGLVTRESLEEISHMSTVAVYVPFSYMLGGVTLLVERSKLQDVDLSVEEALKLGVTAWIKARKSQ